MIHVRHAVLVLAIKAGMLRGEGYENGMGDTRNVWKIVMGKSFEFGINNQQDATL
jgi:hypothetical protein